MNTKQQLAFAWILVAILAVLLIIAGFFLAGRNTQNINVSEKKDLIREHCTGTDQASRDLCAQDLQDLSDILSEFSKVPLSSGTIKINGGQ